MNLAAGGGADLIGQYSADFQDFDIVYDESTDPAVKFHGSRMVSGP